MKCRLWTREYVALKSTKGCHSNQKQPPPQFELWTYKTSWYAVWKLTPQSPAVFPWRFWAAMQPRPKLERHILSSYCPCRGTQFGILTRAVHLKPTNPVYNKPPHTVNRTPKINGVLNNKTFIIIQTRAMGGRLFPRLVTWREENPITRVSWDQ